ncbi:MAG: carbohydrate ABC transporter permease [Phycisphaerales bacterium]
MRDRPPKPAARVAIYLALSAVSTLFLLPLVWMVSTSIKPVEQTMQASPSLLPEVTAAMVLADLRAKRAMIAAEGADDATLGALDDRIEKWDAAAAAEREIEEAQRSLRRMEASERRDIAAIDAQRTRIRGLEDQVDDALDSVPGLALLLRQAADNYAGRTGPDGKVIVQGVLNDPVIDFMLYLRNTLIVVCLSIVGMVFSSSLVAYGFARVKWRGRGVLFAVVLATMMIPFPVIMGPLFILFKELGWIGTFKPLWVPAWFGSAFNIFLLRQFYMAIPKELDEAARIDGCTHWGVYWRIILPLSRPALAVVALFHFLFVWNDFLGPLIFLRDRDQFTLALGLQLYQSQAGNVPWNLLMAASTMVLVPVLAVFLLAQSAFIDGIATSGLKE